jgi:hypothetical protein
MLPANIMGTIGNTQVSKTKKIKVTAVDALVLG